MVALAKKPSVSSYHKMTLVSNNSVTNASWNSCVLGSAINDFCGVAKELLEEIY